MVRLRIGDNSAGRAMTHEWDADHYLRFADARTLPAMKLN
jgi:hypothetical protein